MLQSGTVLGDRYILLEPVARGGMGQVWRADDSVLGRTVAVKTLLPNLSGRPDFAARFRAEARAMAALSDPAIVEIYDYGQTDGLAYLVMRFIDGESLQRLLRRTGPLPPATAMALMAQAAGALQAAHEQSIVHRDVKPSNLIVRSDGRLMLTDFGIAQLIAGDRLTEAGAVTGTAEYLSPEQVNGSPVTPATDVYALGVVAYEMLTRSRPFEADTPVAVALKHTRDQPPPLPAEIPDAVRHVVMRALAKDPEQRWLSAADMAEAANRAAQSMRVLGRKRWGRTGLVVAAAALVLLATAGALAVGRGPAGGGDGVFGSGILRLPGFGGAPDETAGGTLSDDPGPSMPGGTGPNAAPIPGGPAASGTGTPPATPTPTPTVTTTSPAPIPTTTPPDEKPSVVPDVVGMTEATARTTITNAGLTPQVRYGTATGPCVVLSQFPKAGTQVQPQAVVGIELARPTGECAILN
jgi:eukaryotic-like serine/threonine-protein kinase